MKSRKKTTLTINFHKIRTLFIRVKNPFFLIIILAGIIVGTIVVRRMQLIKKVAAQIPHTANLNFSRNLVRVAPSQTFSVDVNLTTGNNAVVGADIIVLFDRNKLTLQNITKPAQGIFKTYVPVTSTGSFDAAKVIANANKTGSGVEFGIAAFDWNVGLTGSFTGLLSPVATLTFQAKPGTGGITDSLRFRFDGISSTTDSNVVANPAAVGDPEDILLQPQGSLSSVTVEIITPTITPTLTRTPTVAPSAARLRFKLQLPDILSSTTSIPSSDVQIEVRDGTNSVGFAGVDLVRSGNYFQTRLEVSFNILQNKTYTLLIKTNTSVRRMFAGVNLVRSQTLDCTVANNPACGELIGQRDVKLLLSGDSDGFTSTSGSYNRVDSADLQLLSTYFNRIAIVNAANADFNLDGTVNIKDLDILGKNYGQRGD